MDGRQAVRDLDLSGATRTGWVEGMIFKGKYKLVRKLGRGGQSEAWQAEDLEASDDEQTVHVVLKLLPQDVSGSHVELLRIRKNYQKVHDLVHQRIAAYRAFEQDGGDCMVVMELVPGVTLAEYRLEYAGKHGSFPLSEAVRLCRQIAEGLDYAHSRQVAHRDVKPENIMVTPQGDVKIIDFGLASDIRSSLSRVSMRPAADSSGTNLYKAPEQWRGQPPRYGTDQYALAAVFYELLSEFPPFFSDDPGILRACVLNDPPQPLPMLSEAQNRALLKALAKEPEERFASCAAFIDAVEGGLRETASTPPAAPAAGSGGAWRWIAAAALIVLAAGAYFMLQSSREAAARQAEQEAAGLAEATAKAEADAAAAAPAPGGQSSEAERAAQAEKHAADYARFMETGESHLADGRYDEAAVMFNQAKQVEGYASDEQADAKLRAVEGARAVAAAAAKREEDYANLMKAGREYLLANRYAEAEASFDKAMTVEGYEEDAQAKAGMQAVKDALARAEAERQRAETERDAGKYADLMEAGESHLAAKRFDLAEMSFRRAKEIQGYASDVKAEAGLDAVAKARAQDALERQRAEAERQRAEAQRQRDSEYARLMGEGEEHLRGNRFADAETSFEQAMVVEGYELDEKALARLDAVKTAQSEWEATEGKMRAWLSEQPIKLGEKLAESFKVDGNWWLWKGSSLMSFAAFQGRVDVMEWLKEKGEEVNAKTNDGYTPMHHAASGGHVSAMEWLKANGADVNAKTNDDSTPMHSAAFGGHDSAMDWLKRNGADVNAKGNDGATPMYYAAYGGHVSVMDWLKANGSDVNAKSNDGTTPMHSAAFWGHVSAMEWLKKNGADVNAKTNDGYTPMHSAAFGGHVSAMEWLKTNGADVNAKANDGSTPMHHAAFGGHVSAMDWLKANGADVNAKTNDDSTPMHSAAFSGHVSAMDWLKANGLDVNAKKDYGYTPMHEAAFGGEVSAMDWLKANGLDVNAKRNDGSTPMHSAAFGGEVSAMEWLKKNGADVNAKNNDGSTPMHEAASGGHVSAMEWLKANGADVNAKTNDGATPFDSTSISPEKTKKWLQENGGKSGKDL